MTQQIWQYIAQQISAAETLIFTVTQVEPVGGGCVSKAYRLRGTCLQQTVSYFVKINNVRLESMFAAEQAGLIEINASQTLRVPRPVCSGSLADQAFLVLEYVQSGRASPRSDQLLGEQLAAMHRHTAGQYGWNMDNAIGATPQINTPATDWIEFWRRQRLAYQLQLAERHGYGGRWLQRAELLLLEMDALFASHLPAASLLHGDLWSGNTTVDMEGRPLVYDPAVYYGDRETDLAMTELFGRFAPRFYQAYQSVWPLDDGYALRKTLYNLYHILNHLNLFGGGYRDQAEQMIGQLLAEIR